MENRMKQLCDDLKALKNQEMDQTCDEVDDSNLTSLLSSGECFRSFGRDVLEVLVASKKTHDRYINKLRVVYEEDVHGGGF
jgi:hypothetical protein